MIAVTTPARASAPSRPTGQRKAIVVAALVLLVHVLVLGLALYQRTPPVLQLEPPRSISVQLIAAPTPPAPPPPQAVPTPPQPAPPVPPPPRPHPVVRPLPKPVTQSTRPTETPVAPPAPPTAPAPVVVTPPSNPVPAMPATLPADTTPKSVEHLSCAIPPPEYSAISRRNGDSGTVLVKIVIDAGGRVETANVARSSGFPRLDDAAVQAALQSRCHAHLENGQGIRSAALVPFRFTLDQ